MNALDSLRLKIKKTFSSALHEAAWGDPRLMSKAFEEVRSVFDTACDPSSRRSIAGTLEAFRRTHELHTFLDLKYACLGITQKIGEDGWMLIEDDELFLLLLKKVSAPQQTPRRLLKCYQGLLSGYFDYNIYSSAATEQGKRNWRGLRTFLNRLLPIAGQTVPVPGWIKVLTEHRNLLSDDLYERYGTALAQGNYHDLKTACEHLFIPRNSWVWEATVLMRVKAVCTFRDDIVKKHLDQCLSMVTRSSGIVLSEVMKKQCIAQLASRYAKCSSRPEHTGLLDAAVTVIGNPWVNRAAWDAYVRDEYAREMMSSWLKRRLIRDFFRILSEESSNGRKRLQSWLRFEPKIEDMWFALGPHACNHPGPEFREFRKLATDRILVFENGGRPENNALIMRIGDYVFVEFGISCQTCMVFKSSNLAFDPDKKWTYVGAKASELQDMILQEHDSQPAVRGEEMEGGGF